MKVVIDFDNTFFTPQRDIDDGLALLYLLGSPEVEVIGITGTYGNSLIDIVTQNTHRLLQTLGREEIPYFAGGRMIGDYDNPASHQLVQWVRTYPGELAIVATGSLTNLWGAGLMDPTFFSQVKQIVLMGGKTAPLQFQKQEMQELNFSCDPVASFHVLTETPNLAIMTGNHCLDLPFTEDHYEAHFGRYQNRHVVQLIERYSEGWFQDNRDIYGIDGFYNWDTLAASYLVHLEYFQEEWLHSTLSVEGLTHGWLTTEVGANGLQQSVSLNLPRVKEAETLRGHIYNTWLQVDF
ncbi:MAG: nucleoside hydrolase [Aerococcus sp.]|nr:nucleoside hydrolase [Aerococcus sp.]